MSSSTCARARAAGAPRASAGGHSKRSPERSERHTDVLHQRSAPRGAGRRADVASGAAPGNLVGQAHDQPVNPRSGIMSHETMNDLPENVRSQVSDLLNNRLAEAIDLQTQAKQAHWNVKGPQFIALHKLFDEINEAVVERSEERRVGKECRSR